MDVTSMLNYYKNIQDVTNVSSAENKEKATNVAGKEGDAADFTKLLNEEITELNRNAELTSALDKTVITGIGNLTELSMDMLRTSSGQKVLSELVNGQFASIVTDDSFDKDEASVAEQILGKDDSDTATLQELVAKMEDIL